MTPEPPAISVIVPASNEAGLIGPCLAALFASDWPHAAPPQVIVVANGCTDTTVAEARAMAPRAAERGWSLTVLDLEKGGKLAALNAGDGAAKAPMRAYLDADVIVSPPLLAQLHRALDRSEPAYASGTVAIPRPQSAVSRAYRRTYLRVPFMTHGVPGCGLFAVNGPGRARWHDWPHIISDDTFARLSFAPGERHKVPARYDWPLVEGYGALVRVRRRQNAGVEELAAKFPQLLANDDKPGLGAAGLAKLALRDPLGFAAYAGVALAVRITRRSGNNGWDRGR